MSFYNVVPSDYHEGPAGTPGWADAPVPGWGINPFRAGPVRVGVGMFGLGLGQIGDYYRPGGVPGNDLVLPRYAPLGGCGCGVGMPFGAVEDQYRETSWGTVMLAGAGGIALGVLFGFAWWQRPKAGAS